MNNGSRDLKESGTVLHADRLPATVYIKKLIHKHVPRMISLVHMHNMVKSVTSMSSLLQVSVLNQDV